MKKEVYIYGCGGVGNEIAEHLMDSSEYIIRGFIDDNADIKECMGFSSITLNNLLQEKDGEINVIISVGEPAIRQAISEKVKKNGLKEMSICLADHFNPSFSTIGDGTLLHHGSYISTNAHIGKCCMINKGVLVGHDCTLGDYCVLSPKVTLGGNVTVGENTYIGTGALIRNGITIGNNVIVGMGAVVVKDIEDDAVVVGNPAKFVRKNESHRVFGKTHK